MDLLCFFCLVFAMHLCASVFFVPCLFICALRSPAGRGLAS